MSDRARFTNLKTQVLLFMVLSPPTSCRQLTSETELTGTWSPHTLITVAQTAPRTGWQKLLGRSLIRVLLIILGDSSTVVSIPVLVLRPRGRFNPELWLLIASLALSLLHVTSTSTYTVREYLQH